MWHYLFHLIEEWEYPEYELFVLILNLYKGPFFLSLWLSFVLLRQILISPTPVGQVLLLYVLFCRVLSRTSIFLTLIEVSHTSTVHTTSSGHTRLGHSLLLPPSFKSTSYLSPVLTFSEHPQTVTNKSILNFIKGILEFKREKYKTRNDYFVYNENLVHNRLT